MSLTLHAPANGEGATPRGTAGKGRAGNRDTGKKTSGDGGGTPGRRSAGTGDTGKASRWGWAATHTPGRRLAGAEVRVAGRRSTGTGAGWGETLAPRPPARARPRASPRHKMAPLPDVTRSLPAPRGDTHAHSPSKPRPPQPIQTRRAAASSAAIGRAAQRGGVLSIKPHAGPELLTNAAAARPPARSPVPSPPPRPAMAA